MKKIFLLITIILVSISFINAQERFVYPNSFKFPRIKKYSTNPQDFIPKNWKLLGKAVGDLNKDNRKDVVLILQANFAEFINKNNGVGSDPFDTNPRMLLILFRSKCGYKLAEKNNSFVISADSPNMMEPFQRVYIKNNVINFDFEIFFSAGSWSAYNATYKYRYQRGRFVLIGADKTTIIRNTGETELRSYNFLIRKMKIVLGYYSTDIKPKIIWKKFKLNKYRTFQDFIPFTWDIENDNNI